MRRPRRNCHLPGARHQGRNLRLCVRRLGVRAHDHGVGDRDDLIGGQVGARGVLTDGFRAAGLVDANGPKCSALLGQHVGADSGTRPSSSPSSSDPRGSPSGWTRRGGSLRRRARGGRGGGGRQRALRRHGRRARLIRRARRLCVLAHGHDVLRQPRGGAAQRARGARSGRPPRHGRLVRPRRERVALPSATDHRAVRHQAGGVRGADVRSRAVLHGQRRHDERRPGQRRRGTSLRPCPGS